MAESGTSDMRFEGIPLSDGVAVGIACLHRARSSRQVPVYRVGVEDTEAELVRFAEAVRAASERLEAVRARVAASVGSAEAAIFAVQEAILRDPELLDRVTERIRAERSQAEVAVGDVLDDYEKRLLAVEDEYMRGRATDIGEVKQRLLDALSGDVEDVLVCGKCQETDRVIVAEELTASVVVDAEVGTTVGFASEHGGRDSHAAILARAMGVPAVGGVRGLREHVVCGQTVLVDGGNGLVVVNPSAQVVAEALGRRESVAGGLLVLPPVPALTVMANISLSTEVDEAVESQAEGIGLYRTEFEVLSAGRFLSGDEMLERYGRVVRAMAGKPCVFRLLDLGSDKSAPFVGIPAEVNPALGWRGARLLLGRRDLLSAQVRALALASREGEVHVLYPMIVDVEQFRLLRAVVEDCAAGIAGARLKHGAMFEVPSACLLADELFACMDFGSVGTNDLTQYLFAVDRDNDRVAGDFRPDHDVVWRLLASVAAAATRAGKPLSVCGEIAGEPRFVARLLDAGIRCVSTSMRRIGAVRLAAAEVSP